MGGPRADPALGDSSNRVRVKQSSASISIVRQVTAGTSSTRSPVFRWWNCQRRSCPARISSKHFPFSLALMAIAKSAPATKARTGKRTPVLRHLACQTEAVPAYSQLVFAPFPRDSMGKTLTADKSLVTSAGPGEFLCRFDATLLVREVSEHWAECFGTETLADLIHTEDHAQLFNEAAPVIRLRQRTGEWLALRWLILPGVCEDKVALAQTLIPQDPLAGLDQMGQGHVLCDSQDRIIFADAHVRALMQARGISLGSTFMDLVRDAMARGAIVEARGRTEAWLRDFAAARDASDNFKRDVHYRPKVWVRYTDRRVPGGRLSLWIDVSDLYLRRAELEAVLEGSEIGTWDHDFARGLSTCNAAFAAHLGLTLQEASPYSLERLSEFIHPEDRAGIVAARMRHVAGESPNLDAELRLRQSDGSYAWFRSRGRIVVRDEHGRPLRASGVLIDLTEVKTVTERLTQTEKLLAKVGEAAGAGGFELDFATGNLTITPKMREIRGLPPDSALDFDTAMSAYAPASESLVRKAIEKARDTGRASTLNYI